jgi:glycosyltransferase involved in cell wall biosynthesis
MEIDYINGKRTDKIFGIYKYQMEIVKRLNVELNVIEYDSLMYTIDKKITDNSKTTINSGSSNRTTQENKSLKYITDIGKKTLRSIDKYRYIRIVRNAVKNSNIKHITSQEVAYIQNSLEMDNTVITCHDLIPWVYDKDRSKFWKDNISGLKKADAIITGSEFSKEDIIKYLNYPSENIHIVKDAVDHSRYYENRDKTILNQLNISNKQKVVLYVGSETPRQNVPVLIKAFAQLKKKIPGIKLVKVGESQSYGARENLLKLINDLNLQEDVFFVGYVSEEDIPKWYNASDLLVYPCRYAGFGLPPLEAMACGTPVITSNTTSLPEVVGDAGIMVDPDNDKLLADEMYKVFTNDDLRNRLIKKGIARSKLFQWKNSAEKTFEIYNQL